MDTITIPPDVRSPEPYETEYINRCIGCGDDMGYQNPRQLCRKTYCDQVDDVSQIGVQWQCPECKISLTFHKCPLCWHTRN